MKRPTREQAYDFAVLMMRGVNAIMIWCVLSALILLWIIASENY